MPILLFLLIVLAAIIAALWLLPWWLSVALLVVIGAPLAWVAWKIVKTLQAVRQAVQGIMPAKRVCTLPAGEPFRGSGFAFTCPVECDVSQTIMEGLEAL